MSRQLEIEGEERSKKKRNALALALDHGLVSALEYNGIDFVGFAVKYSAFDCLMTLKAELNGVRHVAFVGSDTIINCILKSHNDASSGSLLWRPDKYHPNEV